MSLKTDSQESYRHYQYEDLHRVVSKYEKTREYEVKDTKPTIHESHQDRSPFEKRKTEERRQTAIGEVFTGKIGWNEVRITRFEKDGILYVTVIEKATGREIRTITEELMGKLAKEFKNMTGKTMDISG